MRELQVDLVQSIHAAAVTRRRLQGALRLHADVGIKKHKKDVDGDAVIQSQLRFAIFEQLLEKALVFDLVAAVTLLTGRASAALTCCSTTSAAIMAFCAGLMARCTRSINSAVGVAILRVIQRKPARATIRLIN